MKTLIHLIITAAILLVFTGCNKDNCRMATLSRDCTGTYLRINGADYFVCNPAKIAGVESNSSLCVEYTLCRTCDDGLVHCAMLRPFDGRLIIKNAERKATQAANSISK